MMKRIFRLVLPALALAFAACSPGVRNAAPAGCLPPIYPDYTGVTIPVGIAPLDFALPDAEKLEVRVEAPDGTPLVSRGESFTRFSVRKWKKLLDRSIGDSLRVYVSARTDGAWKTYDSFGIFVSPDPIDYGLNYRLIAPGYEVYSHMGIYERELGSFRQRGLLENTQFDGCVNCHAYNRGNPSAFSLHIRGDHGATLLQVNGEMAAYNTKTDSTLGFCVYPYWHLSLLAPLRQIHRLLHQQHPPGVPCPAGQDHRSVRPGFGPAGV